ncbi:DUF6491 family protein [Aurantiacibacter gilvus]|uniref:DUF6491 family protein n=1 Tax=Aurantiacibacter gilvus TaxID=3139141 RepID=A0ABU9IB27_9SPHN
MVRNIWVAPAVALGLLSAPAAAQDVADTAPAAERAEEARIPFLNYGAIRSWRADDRDTLYIQDRRRNWYRAELMAPAHELPYANAIGFDTGPIGHLDRFAVLVVEGRRIPLKSLVQVDSPPMNDEA